MQTYERESGPGFVVGVLAGAMVGAGLALLFAPKAGPELRGELSDSLAGVRDAVGDRYRDFAARARADFDEAQSHVERTVSQVQSAASDAAASAVDAAERVTGRTIRG